MTTPEEIIEAAIKLDRVCLLASAQNELWHLRSNRCRVGDGWELPLPLIIAVWDHSSDTDKRERFLFPLQWAQAMAAWEPFSNISIQSEHSTGV